MADTLDKVLGERGIGVCVRDSGQNVLSQNEASTALCGDRVGSACEEGCITLCKEDRSRAEDAEGTRLYADAELFGSPHDVTVIQSGEQRITLIQPLEARHQRALSAFTDAGLTPRENEVIELVVRGASNADICQQLCISHATLRTHLNRAYRKAREHGVPPVDLPPSRQAELHG
jgi:DNA-binding CsgD family transcriptional regulator